MNGAAVGGPIPWRGPPCKRPAVADPHFVWALAAAVPVWGALAYGVAGPLYRPADGLAWVAFLCWQPLVEELVFRGALQGQLLRLLGRQRLVGITLANAATTVVFFSVHLVAQQLVWAMAVVAPSLVFGHLRERLRSVWPVVLLHAVYNAGFAFAAQHVV